MNLLDNENKDDDATQLADKEKNIIGKIKITRKNYIKKFLIIKYWVRKDTNLRLVFN